MKAVLLVVLALALPLALAPMVEAGPYVPPVCTKRTVSAGGTTLTAQVTCSLELELTHCPPVEGSKCVAVATALP